MAVRRWPECAGALVRIEEARTSYFRERVTGGADIPRLGMARSSLKTSNPRSCLFAACEAEVLQAGIIIHHKRNPGRFALKAIRADDRVALFHSDPLAKVIARAAGENSFKRTTTASFRYASVHTCTS